MELIFQETQVNYLKQTVNETVYLEQTADIVVPDALPDIERVVDAFGMAMVRSADCTSSGLGVEGIVQAGVLFASEDGSVHPIHAQIPFSVRRETGEQGTLQCKCTLRSVDARALNSRKLLVRVSIACELCVLTAAEHTCYDITEPAPNLQLKRTVLPLNLPLAVGEKSFSVHEELELTSEQPAIERLLKYVCRTQIAEQKIVGDKAVFKGAVQLQALYEDEKGNLSRGQWSVPFSQYAQLGKELDEAQLHTVLRMLSAEVEPDSQSASRRLLLSIELMAQCMACGHSELSVIEDAFCTDAELTAELCRLNIEGILDCKTLHENLTLRDETPAKSIVDACMYFDALHTKRNAEGVELEFSVNCNVLYLDEEGKLQGKTLRGEASQALALAQNGVCRLVQADGGEIFCTAGHSGMELRLPLAVTVECAAEEDLQAVCGAQIAQMQREDGRRPSVILRRTENDEELWQLAKNYRTSVQTIMQANELQEQMLEAGAMLLIPMP